MAAANNTTCDSCGLPIHAANPDAPAVRYCYACATRENFPTFCTAYPVSKNETADKKAK